MSEIMTDTNGGMIPESVEPYASAIRMGNGAQQAQAVDGALDALAKDDEAGALEEDAVVALIASNTDYTKTALRDELASRAVEAAGDDFEIESVTMVEPEGSEEEPMLEVTGWWGGIPFRLHRPQVSFLQGRDDVHNDLFLQKYKNGIDAELPRGKEKWRGITESWIEQAKEAGRFKVVTEAPKRPVHEAVSELFLDLRSRSALTTYSEWRNPGGSRNEFPFFVPGDVEGVVYIPLSRVSAACDGVEDATVGEVCDVLADRGLTRGQPCHEYDAEDIPSGDPHRVLPMDGGALIDQGHLSEDRVYDEVPNEW